MDGTIGVDGGWVLGHTRDGIWEFLGIPYARAPVGSLRWRAPRRPEPWSGVRAATEPGPLAPQPAASASALPGDPVDQDEDCLHLSVWTPAPDTQRRPVLVWVHGGGFTSGTSASALYRGRRLAGEGGVVVVNVNYRLGALGFLAHRALAVDAGVAGNWALLDQVAALRWVKDHIASFGGDPQNVTVFGESAGAMCVSTLLAMPGARGLFSGAIIQSGPPYTHGLRRAEEAANEFVGELGMSEVSREALEPVPAPELVAALTRFSHGAPRPGELPQQLLPVVDGTTLPMAPLEAIVRGSADGVATIVGTNRDEMSFFLLGDPAAQVMDHEDLRTRIAHSAPGAPADRVVDHYVEVLRRRGEPTAPRDLWLAAGSDVVFRWPSLRLAAALRVHEPRTFVYLFTWASPAFGGALGATHGLEIPFVFGTYADPGISRFVLGEDAPVGAPGSSQRDRAAALSAAMRASWSSFAHTRDPSNGLVPSWPAWDRDHRATMVFGVSPEVEHAPRDDELAVWEAVAPLPDDSGAAVAPRAS